MYNFNLDENKDDDNDVIFDVKFQKILNTNLQCSDLTYISLKIVL